MDRRVTELVRGLRAAGVRVSVAEELDALRAAAAGGVADRARFRTGLRACLVKDAQDQPAFDELFELYFGGGAPPLSSGTEDLSPEDEQALRDALEAMEGRLKRLLEWLVLGEGPTPEQLEALARRAAEEADAQDPRETRWLSRELLRELGFEHLEGLLQDLAEQLAMSGLSPEDIDAILGVAEANRETLSEEIARQVGLELARRRAEQPPEMAGGDELMHKPLQSLSPDEAERLRVEVRRLVARLRSRAALRQKRARSGRLDPRRTLRANQRHGGVPIVLRHRRRRLKPQLVLICDVSTSMRPVAEFMLRLIYELGDQVAQARSFAFNDDLEEISPHMQGNRAAEAVTEVLYAIPPGYYATDLGGSLETFERAYAGAVSHRTSVIVLGDGRNNYRDPRADLLRDLQRRAKRLVWLNPEPRGQWGSGDSDMLDYEPFCDAVYPVRDLAQLAAAVDRLLGG